MRPVGWVVLVWNERRTDDAGFPEAYEGLLRTHGTDYEQVRNKGGDDYESIQRFFEPRSVETAVFDNTQEFDFDGIRGRLLSSSYVPAEGEPGCAEMLVDLQNIFERYESDGRIILP